MLKSRKHPALTSKNKSKQVKNVKIDCVLEMREELLRRQIDQIKQQEQRDEEKYKIEMKNLQERHEKEMELLNINILLKAKQLEILPKSC